jgi:uncharacterized membrane protein
VGTGLQIITALFFLLLPAGTIYLAHHQRWAQRIGVIVLCYGLGLVLGLAGMVPGSVQSVPRVLSEATIVLALPLLLFSLDLRQWSRVAGKALLSLVFAVAAVTGLATVLYFIFRDDSGVAANLAAMSVGVYSGGTPNLAAIKAGLEIPNPQYLAFHSLDTVVGSLYFLFMLTLGIPLFRRLLPATRRGTGGATVDRVPEAAPGNDSVGRHLNAAYDEYDIKGGDEDNYRPLLDPANLGQVGAAIGLAIVVVILSLAIAGVIATITGGERNSAVLIVALTTLGILFSLHPRVRALVLSYRIGMYLIYVFCLAVSSMVSLEELARLDATVAVFLFVVVFGGLALHALLCRLARVDGDTFLVTSVAAVASPPFVPLMARALNNPAAMLPGMTTGVIGYALGSYIGISLGLYLGGL